MGDAFAIRQVLCEQRLLLHLQKFIERRQAWILIVQVDDHPHHHWQDLGVVEEETAMGAVFQRTQADRRCQPQR